MFVLCAKWGWGNLKWLQFVLVVYKCLMAIVVGMKSNEREVFFLN